MGSPTLYAGILIGLTALFVAMPFVIYAARNRHGRTRESADLQGNAYRRRLPLPDGCLVNGGGAGRVRVILRPEDVLKAAARSPGASIFLAQNRDGGTAAPRLFKPFDDLLELRRADRDPDDFLHPALFYRHVFSPFQCETLAERQPESPITNQRLFFHS